ncbi:Uma2 family endonuclease [Leptothermofonsia sichuanensis E412]|uniref:Uma2 family endonuclease n=1 Tax=Leptothermofonsia sichuanensis TaxID=2917832 RepID=UPI001CA7A737|nr:Uma2 family endonuclease [Leptothermofonsia sichuanensis]QZZ22340.1 Uma2 family endonuclease [Leptothermofonsia sichuanensis E412]
MTAITNPPSQIVYPSSDGEPVAETYDHLYVLLTTLEVLRQYLKGQRATVLANQFFYYAQGFPKLRVAPDVMVIFDVEPGGRDNYKLWEEGQVPRVIFEMTSRGTKDQDTGFKKGLYEQLEVQEYWLFDPKGEWLEGQLQGYQLQNGTYVPMAEHRSAALKLRLEIEGNLLAFYREDTGEKLLLPDELAETLKAETQRRIEAEQRAEQERQRAEQERQRAEELQTLLERYQAQFGELTEE